ncbi:lipopolysaccharide biosynthesis protein, partial [Prevotella sp. 10(H)]|uniref:lipopolysaccharide biosynthesis protein n=1 Tax=Prevotella sp. 10(H) TaxID=1158294 RepID=UPI0004A73E2E
MSANVDNNKRIAKNTVFLYIRQLVIIVVSLYTSRVVINTLGIEDFGIYNIVGGIVVLFSFLNGAMSSATQRFLNFELGKNNLDGVKRIFSISMTSYILIAFIVIILAETIGLWFLNTQINIPEDRIVAANWVYQFSLLTFCANLIRVPYNATIIAYERMNFYAYTSIVEAVLKLGVVFLLMKSEFDRLIFYAFLIFVVTLLVALYYRIYCGRNFETARYKVLWDKKLFGQIMSFSGWSLFGSVANMGTQQGISIVLNLFYGVTINAAVGVANQVTNAIYNFISNFQTAFNPQIVKLYASDSKDDFLSLIFKASKLSYFLFIFISIPILICTDFILEKWLVIVPEYASEFCRLIILFLLIEAIGGPLWMSVQATGKIATYQIIMSVLIFLNLPISYIALKMGYSPSSVWVVRIIMNLIIYVFRIFYLKNKIQLLTLLYFKKVILRSIVVTLISLPIPFTIYSHMDASWFGFSATCAASFLISGLVIYYIGLNRTERN